jgi:hypothetical protein
MLDYTRPETITSQTSFNWPGNFHELRSLYIKLTVEHQGSGFLAGATASCELDREASCGTVVQVGSKTKKLRQSAAEKHGRVMCHTCQVSSVK